MRLAIAVIAVSSFVACQPTPNSSLSNLAEDATHAYVRLPSKSVTADFVAKTGFERDHQRDAVYAFGYLPRAAAEDVVADLGSDVTIIDEQEFARHAHDLRTLARIDAPDSELENFEDYHNYAQLTTELQNLAGEHPELATLTSAGRSGAGRELWLMKISDNADIDESEPKLLYVANMHGDETVGREMMVYLIRLLLNEYGTNPRITNLVDNAQIYIMPSMNPDGFESGRRHNRNGSDLNRDFPDFTSDPTDTPAGRQPETQAIMALHRQHHFVLALNFHGGEVCFNMPWDTRENSTRATRFGDDGLMNALGRVYADTNPVMRDNDGGTFDNGVTYGYEWYEVDGGLQDWSIYYRESTHATVELSMVKYPAASQLARHWDENREAMLAYLESGLFGYNLEVVDDAGVAVSNAAVRVAATGRTVRYGRSDIHRPAMAGATTLEISAPGFETLTINATAEAFGGDLTRVTLSR